MGRQNGAWSPIYAQAWDHAKTARASAALMKAERKIGDDVAPFLVLGWLNRLCLWCLASSEKGRTALLTDARVATIAWPQTVERRAPARAGALVRASLRAGGFLEDGPDGEQIHDFEEHHSRLLKERARKAAKRAQDEDVPLDELPDAPPSASPSASSGADTGAAVSADTGADAGTPASAPTDTGTGTDTGSTRTPSRAETLARKLADRLAGSLNYARKAIKALIAEGWALDRVEAAIDHHASAGMASWDWLKAVKRPALAVVGSNGTGAAEREREHRLEVEAERRSAP